MSHFMINFNRGLVATQESRPRINLSLDPMEQRCGLTGTIPSAEQGNCDGCDAPASDISNRDGGCGAQARRSKELSEETSWFEPIDTDALTGLSPVEFAQYLGRLKEGRPVLFDDVIRPKHYNNGSIECIEAIEAALTPEEFRGACKANVLKYVWREQNKGGVESLKKAKWYLDRLISLLDEGD